MTSPPRRSVRLTLAAWWLFTLAAWWLFTLSP